MLHVPKQFTPSCPNTLRAERCTLDRHVGAWVVIIHPATIEFHPERFEATKMLMEFVPMICGSPFREFCFATVNIQYLFIGSEGYN